jgi:hypothetical protein
MLVSKILMGAAIDAHIRCSDDLIRSRFASAEQHSLTVDRYRSFETLRHLHSERPVRRIDLSDGVLVAAI